MSLMWNGPMAMWARRHRFGLALLAIALALILQCSGLVAAGINNLVSLRLQVPWRQVVSRSVLPPCQTYAKFPVLASHLRAALRLAPWQSGTMTNLGRVLWLEGRCQEAVDVWLDAVGHGNHVAALGLLWAGQEVQLPTESAAELAEYAYVNGLYAQLEKQLDTATAWYVLALSLQPQFKTARRLSELYQERRQPEVELVVWQTIQKHLANTAPEYWWAAGRMAELLGHWQEAAQTFSRGGGLAADPYDYYMRSGQAYQRIEMWNEATAAFTAALEVQPSLLYPYTALADVAVSQKTYQTAVFWYQKAKTVSPERYEPLAGLGYVYLMTGDYASAQQSLEAALRFKPQDYWSAYLLALSYNRLGNGELAEKMLGQAIAWHPGHPWQWAILLGDWRLELGKSGGASEAYQTAKEWGAPEAELQAHKVNTNNR